MLQTERQHVLTELITAATHEELIWMSGYLSGALSGKQVTTKGAEAASEPSKMTIVFGTETGNAKSLATKISGTARQKGHTVKLVALDQYRLTDLQKESIFIVVISTQGDGAPPAAAKKFYDYIHREPLVLSKMKYSVLALGDSSYPLFCQTGVETDTRLHQAGGNRIMEVMKCDTDYEAPALHWFATLLEKIQEIAQPAKNAATAIALKATEKQVYSGTVLTNISLNDNGSDKQTHHIEIATEDIAYLPGDAISLIPENPLATVQEILDLRAISADEQIVYRQDEATIFDLLKYRLNIVRLSERTVKAYAKIVQQDIPEAKISLIDLLKIYPVKDAAQFREVIHILEPQTPRQYSIASAPQAHDSEIHLVVAQDDFLVNDERKHGLCSSYLNQLPEGARISFHIHPNNRFRLPAPEQDVIMIGPGTGIAPFRSFLWERETTGTSGRNWLFFGDRQFTTDFLYQTEIQNWIDCKLLTRFNAAFSRDQPEKLYVQHRMTEQGGALWEWLENGAYIYVCGTRDPMSKDVERALLQIFEKYGKKKKEEAVQYLEALSEAGRYLKDVY